MSEVKTVSMRYDKYIEMKEKAEKYPALVEKLKEFVFEIGDLSDAIIKVIEERDTAIEDINSYLHIHGVCPFCALYEQRSWLKANGKDCRKKDCGRWRGVKKKMYVWKSEGDKLSCVPVTYDNIPDYQTLLKQCANMKQKIDDLNAELHSLEIDYDTLRDHTDKVAKEKHDLEMILLAIKRFCMAAIDPDPEEKKDE